MTQQHEQTAPTSGATATPDNADPLAKLHRMSTTAGVASQQYVAVNTASIVAAMLGVASALSLFSTMLLLIPVVGVIVSIVAWRQVADSNGTETGKPMAALGLLLSLLIGGGVAAKEYSVHRQTAEDARAMAQIMTQVAAELRAKNYQAAYDRFTDPFKARIAEPIFAARLDSYQKPENFGLIKSMTWNDVPPAYYKDGELAEIVSLVQFERSEGRLTFIFRKVNGAWKPEDIAEIFSPRGSKPQ